MRILHLYKTYWPVVGGIEGHVQTLAEAQAAAGHAATVLVTQPGRRSGHEQLAGVQIIRAAAPLTLASTPLSLGYLHEAARQRPDIVHVHSPYPLAEIAAWRGRAPYVLTFHAEVTRLFQRAVMAWYAPLQRRVLARAARVIVSNPRLAERGWLRSLNPTMIPFGVEVGRFAGNSNFKLQTSNGEVRMLFVGRLRHYKGVDVLLRALALLPGARLTVAGDGPEAPRLRALAARLGLGERVRFAGEVSPATLLDLYREADIFVLPAISRAEAFGVALLEAMASGLPCVTTEVGTGTSWVVRDGVTGLVAPPRDPDALAAALARLAADPPLRAQMGAASLARVEAEFTREQMVARVEAVYGEVMQGG